MKCYKSYEILLDEARQRIKRYREAETEHDQIRVSEATLRSLYESEGKNVYGLLAGFLDDIAEAESVIKEKLEAQLNWLMGEGVEMGKEARLAIDDIEKALINNDEVTFYQAEEKIQSYIRITKSTMLAKSALDLFRRLTKELQEIRQDLVVPDLDKLKEALSSFCAIFEASYIEGVKPILSSLLKQGFLQPLPKKT
jgi:hypothetical protein